MFASKCMTTGTESRIDRIQTYRFGFFTPNEVLKCVLLYRRVVLDKIQWNKTGMDEIEEKNSFFCNFAYDFI